MHWGSILRGGLLWRRRSRRFIRGRCDNHYRNNNRLTPLHVYGTQDVSAVVTDLMTLRAADSGGHFKTRLFEGGVWLFNTYIWTFYAYLGLEIKSLSIFGVQVVTQ
jgi:hypothetical protein